MLVTQQAFEEQVQRVTREAACPAHGLFGPDSVTWRVARESIAFLGAGRAALLQLAHPYVAHAIDQHSQTRADPTGRFNRTFLYVNRIIFGDLDGAVGAARRVRRVHDGVHGPVAETVGRYPEGHRYHAHDERALLWVWATLIETSVLTYEIGVAPLSRAEKDAYCREALRFTRLFGIPDALVPADWAAFEAYFARTIASSELAVGRPAAEIARFLLASPNAPARPLMRWYRSITVGLLPPRLRGEFGMRFGRADRLVFDASLRALHRSWPKLPERSRFVPDYIEARRRIAGRPHRDTVGRAVEQMLLRLVRPRSGA